MAGKGQRYSQQNFGEIKPLIKFQDKPLFIWSINSIRQLLDCSNLHLVICEEDQIEDKIIAELAKDSELNKHQIKIVKLKQRTSGPAETALLALKNSNLSKAPVIFCDCDLYCQGLAWMEFIKNWSTEDIDALLIYFYSKVNKSSYLKKDLNNLVTAVAEKQLISNDAIAGLYAFKNAQTFMLAAEKVLKIKTHQEPFISDVYAEMLKNNNKIKAFKSDKIILLGSPEELSEANNKSD